MIGEVTVLIPTMRRPESLARAVRSVFAQDLSLVRDLVIVDSDPDGSAAEAAAALKAEAPFPLTYVHERSPGVATARNAGLRAATGSLIAFLDDDEEAEPGWLAALVRARDAFEADVVFGPVRGVAPSPGWAAAYVERLHSREGPAQSQVLERGYGCGNSLMVRATALPGSAPFDTAYDQIGGEDDILFDGINARGGRFAWAADAVVREHVPAERATLSYALRRAFAYGQSPCQERARKGRRDPLGIALWMAIGAAQAAVFGAGFAVAWLVRRDRSAALLGRAASGLGKVFWTKAFEPKFYGQAALRANAGRQTGTVTAG